VSAAAPGTEIATNSGTDTTAALQNATGTHGVSSWDPGGVYDGYITRIRNFKITAVSFGAGWLEVVPTENGYRWDCMAPWFGTGPFTHQLQSTTTGPNASDFADVSGATTLFGTATTTTPRLYLRMKVTDTGNGNAVSYSNVEGPIQPYGTTEKIVLVGNSHFAVDRDDSYSSEFTQAQNIQKYLPRFLEDRDASVITVGVSGAKAIDFVDSKYNGSAGQYYAAAHAAIVAAASKRAIIDFGRNEAIVPIAAADFKNQLLNVIAWLRNDGVTSIHLDYGLWCHTNSPGALSTTDQALMLEYYAKIDEILASGIAKPGVLWENATGPASRHHGYDDNGLHIQAFEFDSQTIRICRMIDRDIHNAVSTSLRRRSRMI
jgi:hypothetical protein